MKYESKFSIGDTVWMTDDRVFHQIIRCAACVNTGKVKIGAEEFICPKCSGRCAHEQYAGRKFYIYGQTTVGQVRVCDEPGRYNQDEPNPKYEYMLHDTGIGSGQIWKQESLFATKEEAQAFCDGRNGILPAHETEIGPAPVDSYGRVVAAT